MRINRIPKYMARQVAIAAMPTLTPMPAFAPVERRLPEEPWSAKGGVVADEAAVLLLVVWVVGFVASGMLPPGTVGKGRNGSDSLVVEVEVGLSAGLAVAHQSRTSLSVDSHMMGIPLAST